MYLYYTHAMYETWNLGPAGPAQSSWQCTALSLGDVFPSV